MLAEFQLEKRDPVESDQVSDLVKQATVDTEDVRFYQHGGVDLPGIARAFVNNLAGGSLEGASTITQQLVRNTVLTQEANEISIERKVREGLERARGFTWANAGAQLFDTILNLALRDEHREKVA